MVVFACNAEMFCDVRYPEPPPSAQRTRLLLAASSQHETLLDVVDVMLAFDVDALAWIEANDMDAETFSARLVGQMNEVLRNSSLGGVFSFRLVGAEKLDVSVRSLGRTNAVRIDQSFKQMEYAIEGSSLAQKAWMDLNDRRNAAGADVMMILMDADRSASMQASSNALGVLNEDKAWNDPSVLSFFADRAFGICEIATAEAEYTVIHEVGHIMGAGHCSASQVNPAKIATGPQLFDYSSAYIFDCGEARCFTVMGYPFDGYGNSGFVRAPVFSSPDIVFTAKDGSSAVPGAEGLYDNARTLRETYSYVAGFRVHSVPYDMHALEVTTTAGGSVTGIPDERMVEAGTSVRLVAKADSGYGFAGWYDCVQGASDPVLRTKSQVCSFEMPGEDMRLLAVFEENKAPETGIASIECEPGECHAGEAFEPLKVEVASELPVTLSATGLPPGLALDTSAFTIGGTPSRPGVYSATLVARNSSGARMAKSVEFTVGNWRDGEIGLADSYGPFIPGLQASVKMPEGTAGCKVSGLPIGMTWRPSSLTVAGAPAKPGEYTVRFARGGHMASATFVVSARPEIPPSVAAHGAEIEDGAVIEVFAGVDLMITVAPSGEAAGVSPVSVKVSGLPAGLSYSAASGTIHGVPKSPSRERGGVVVPSVVKARAVNRIGWSGLRTFGILVKPLPEWAFGTFYGSETLDGETGFTTVQIQGTGKISGKTRFSSRTVAFSASGYSAAEGDGERFLMSTVRRFGGRTVTNELAVSRRDFTPVRGIGVVEASGGGGGFDALQDLWSSRDSGVRIVRRAVRTFDVTELLVTEPAEGDTLTAKVGVSGAVTLVGRISGNRVSGSSRICPFMLENGVLRSQIAAVLPLNGQASFPGHATRIHLVADVRADGSCLLEDFAVDADTVHGQ